VEKLILQIDKTKLFEPEELPPGIYAPQDVQFYFELLIKMHDGNWCNIDGTKDFTPKENKFYKIKKIVK